TQPLGDAFGNLFSSFDFGGIFAGVAHTGGIADALSAGRTVPAAAFAGAPRLHGGGIAGDEVPTILKRGEGVFTPEQMKALGGPGKIEIDFNVINEFGPEVQVQKRQNGAGGVPDIIFRKAVAGAVQE